MKSRSRIAPDLMFVAITLGFLAFLQNKYGQFSDIRGFYFMHFADGQHYWPFSNHTLKGSNEVMHPVEYPAVTGLIMWLISFLVKPTQSGPVQYYTITALFNIILFALTAHYLMKLTNKKYAILFAISPAVLYSLNRNWDIWAIPIMLMAILHLEKRNYKKSSFFLALSIATKFFPLVIILPILIYFVRQKRLGNFLSYSALTLAFWFLINAPFIIINFSGWSYFYKFSFSRGLGAGSVWDISSKLGIDIPSTSFSFYILNCLIFMTILLYLTRLPKALPPSATSFLVMFGFMLFNKQYSMQYVIWLTCLSLLQISKLSLKLQKGIFPYFLLWQVSEIFFQYSFFQNILTNSGGRGSLFWLQEVSDTLYASVGLSRYFFAVLFTSRMSYFMYTEIADEVSKNRVVKRKKG